MRCEVESQLGVNFGGYGWEVFRREGITEVKRRFLNSSKLCESYRDANAVFSSLTLAFTNLTQRNFEGGRVFVPSL